MKKLLFACALAVCGLPTPTVNAQDFCCPPQCDPCCFEGDFSGLYIGGNVGALSHTAHRNDLDGFVIDTASWTTNNTNVTAGVMLGYDWQCCNTLVGIVGDWNWVNTRHRVSNATVIDDGIRSDSDWFATIRVRAGLAVGEALVYVTGGGAANRFHNNWTALGGSEFDFRTTRWGWVGGAGTEFMLGCNWSLGLEFLYFHVDDYRRTVTIDDAVFAFGHSDSSWLGRLTLNYRFGDLCSCF